MNKGIIMEVRKHFSIVLSDGIFHRVMNKKDMTIGGTILFTEEDILRRTYRYNAMQYAKKYGTVAAAFIAILFMSMMIYNNNYAVYSVVTMDINPSVEVSLNKYDEVIRVKAINEDGKSFESLNLAGNKLEEALDALVKKADELGYIYETTTVMFTAVPMRGKADAEMIVNRIESIVVKGENYQDLNIAITSSTKDKLKEALKTETPLPLLELKADIEGAASIKALFLDEEVVEALTVKGKVKIKNSMNIGKEKERNEVVDKDENKDDHKVAEESVVDEKVKGNENSNSNGNDSSNNSSSGNANEKKYQKGDLNALENRNDLNEIINKLQYILDHYAGVEGLEGQVAKAQVYIDGVTEALAIEPFDFNLWKTSGQELLKLLRSEGLETSLENRVEAEGDDSNQDDDPERAQDEIHSGNFDDDKDYDHDRDRISQDEEEEDEEEEDEEEEDDEEEDKQPSNNGKQQGNDKGGKK